MFGGTLNTGHLNRKYRVTLFLLAAALLSGCGSSMRPRDGSVTAYSTSPEYGAQCNTFASTGAVLSGRVTAYHSNGTLIEDRVRLRFTSIAAEFSQSTNHSIRFFRWRVDANGATTLDPQPLSFVVERNPVFAGMGSSPISGTLTALTLTDVNNLAWYGGIAANTVQDFFNNVTITVLGVDYSWNALKVVLYNGSEPVGQADLLLPVFLANPNAYAATHHPTLAQLHPFWNQRFEAGVSDADWLNRSKNFCF